MIKPIEMSCLSDGFLLETVFASSEDGDDSFYVATMHTGKPTDHCRPALNYPHFNNGTMTLPDGLVVETMEYHCDAPDLAIIAHGKVCFLSLRNEIQGWDACNMSDLSEMCAVKILGVTAEYGAQLGMEVIEV